MKHQIKCRNCKEVVAVRRKNQRYCSYACWARWNAKRDPYQKGKVQAYNQAESMIRHYVLTLPLQKRVQREIRRVAKQTREGRP